MLGPVEAWSGGQRVGLGERRQRSVAAVLLTEADRVVSAGSLVERVWGEQPPASARSALYSYLTRIRAVLDRMAADGGKVRLTRSSGGYLLEVDPDAVDLHRFDRLVEQARTTEDTGQAAATWTAALQLWRGDPYEDLSSPWLDQMRDTLHQRWLAAVIDRNEVELARGRHAELLAELTDLGERQPYDERLIGQLMLAAYRCGRQAEALRHFETVRRRLAEELGVDPGPELRRLHHQVLTADPVLAAPEPLVAVPPAAEPATVASASSAVGLDRAAGDLATAVTVQWTAEAETRSVRRPAPLQVRWAATGRPVAVAAPQRIPSGDISDVAAKFTTLTVPQLVVLGEPGAGKTVLAILLTLGLSADRAPHDPVPVLLSLSSWNPHREHVHTWLAYRLLEDYPGLGNTAAYGPSAATRLVTEGRVLPILDGLDETPPALHAAAIDALDRAIAGGRPLVVTCRADEYENAVHRGGILASAAVVEIEPVELDDAISFLTARHHPGDTRWQPVIDHLRGHRDGPLARALTTPLMVDLARTTYHDSASDPTELLDPQRFTDRATIERHLLDAFLPAVYAQRPQPPGLSPETVRSHGPDQARRWLTFLARHLRHLQTRDFAWWHLVRAIPRPVRGLVFSLPTAALFAFAGLVARGPSAAWVYGLSTAVGGCAAQGWGARSGPSRVEVRFRGTALPFLSRFVIGVAISVVIGLVWSLQTGPVVILASAFGFGMGLHVWLEVPTEANRASSPATTYAQDRVATLAFALSVAVPIGLFYAFAISVSQPHSHLGAVADPFHLARALPAGLVSALFGWFAFRYVGAVGYGLAGFVVGGQAMAHHIPLSLGLTAGAIFGLAIGLTAALSRSWGVYQLSRAWLALHGQTPLQLNRFLQDAHRRGVLRQTGAQYQFRHTRLHDRLADEPPHHGAP
ncbi:BTAD domain-containing putative transcriptional regulator [Dactylosporangium sp. McL0621]|uniref:BTAD domain-containing putative transcriptional regulator n=1 Tax=Dactylosporangium sp. McL0621 TaxID=3415678 RepID=UPI003CFB0782